ncbi:MAG TPA: NAD(P)(+) transhydrogenase (Re/Si-specific) subunit beta [Planctomycetota bacterium]
MGSALLFILGLKLLGRVKTARTANRWSALGMALAIGATLFLVGEVEAWVLLGGAALGSAVGVLLALRTPMTSMPEMVGFLNGMGGAASACVALGDLVNFSQDRPGLTLASGPTGAEYALAVGLSLLIGAVTFSGSLLAYFKLSGRLQRNRLGLIGSQALNAVLGVACLGLVVWAGFLAEGGDTILGGHLAIVALALVLGLGLVVPIGGADMPVVISLLNSYSGMAASATGFVLQNNLLIVAGTLVGASGIILTKIMCKAMNRSLANVLFANFAEQAASQKDTGYTGVKSASPEEAAPVLEAASSVIICPGYGMAVAQAQHKVRELAQLLEKKGINVRYAIHPVAGRMPGHMNVLLAEADVPYDRLFDLDAINGDFQNTDVVIVIGANDVCNPAALEDPKSPIAGMPVLSVWDARTVFVVKRSLASGYAGIKNPLFERENTLMCFGDAKAYLEQLVAELKGS